MGKQTIITVLLLITFCRGLHAQAIDNTLSFRNIPSEKYVRINYENDFFAAFDRDYTQGILVEKVHPGLAKFPLMKILWHPAGNIKYGLAIEQDCYTPNQIDKYDIQYGDRPYAGVLALKSFIIVTNEKQKFRTSSSITLGVLGQAAGGEQMQRTIHHWIQYTQPEGWHNQIQNDLVLNYQVNLEKQLYHPSDHFLLAGYGSARLGTLSDKLSAGFTASLGSFHSSFEKPSLDRKFQWYIYVHVTGNVVGYDATLQGGLLNHSSAYTIDASDVSRFTLQNRYGLVLVFHSVYLEYYRSGSTEEYNTGIYHRTGGLQLGFGF